MAPTTEPEASHSSIAIAKNPPRFNAKKSYQRFKDEVKAWTKVTSVPKEKWAYLIALNLPEDAEDGDLKGMVLDAGVDLDGDAGFKNLFDFLDTHLKKDETCDLIDKIRSFMKLKKGPDQTMREYLSTLLDVPGDGECWIG